MRKDPQPGSEEERLVEKRAAAAVSVISAEPRLLTYAGAAC